MKQTIPKVLAAAAALVLCALFGAVLLSYARPMADQTLDLSLGWPGEAMPEDWVYDQKGWTVFTREGDTVTELAPDGLGGFTGLARPGQTFYFSRTLTEQLDNPTLQLSAAEYSVAVFLDGELIYTDCPELDNRVGFLELPMLEWYREEPVVVTLPPDYAGRTLTVAQSTSPWGGEKQSDDLTVWPCAAALYCGYAYESALIAESFQTAIPAVLFFLAGALLLALFLWRGFHGKWDPGLPCAALAAFLWLTSRMALISFAHKYFRHMVVDVAGLSRLLAVTVLLVFLASRLTGRRKAALWLLAGLQGAAVVPDALPQVNSAVGFLWRTVPETLGLIGLGAALACALWEWRRGNRFSRFFCPLALAGLLALGGAVCACAPLRRKVIEQLWLGAQGYFLWPLAMLATGCAVVSAVTDFAGQEIARRAEARLLAQRSELAQSSYEVLRRQNEQVMMLRHDMMKHFQLLRQTTADEKTAAYLDGLIGENETIRPVVQSGNEMLDIILNGKLSAAADAGIAVELVRVQAPDKLPLTDAELCSLMMNVMDNAVQGACVSGAEQPYIRLDLHVKSDFFVFACENSAAREPVQGETKKETVPEHGLGLKIIRQVARRYGDLIETERGDGFYRVTLAIPLH